MDKLVILRSLYPYAILQLWQYSRQARILCLLQTTGKYGIIDHETVFFAERYNTITMLYSRGYFYLRFFLPMRTRMVCADVFLWLPNRCAGWPTRPLAARQ